MQAMQGLTPAERQQAIRGMVEGLDARLRRANARKVLGENDKAIEAYYARADAIAALAPAQLADWAEAHVRLIAPGAAPAPEAVAVAVLERLEKAEPRNALALFYLGAAAFAQGDKPAAARRWKTLLALPPRDVPIRGDAGGENQRGGREMRSVERLDFWAVEPRLMPLGIGARICAHIKKQQ